MIRKINFKDKGNTIFVAGVSILLGLFIFAALSMAPKPINELPVSQGSKIEKIGNVGYDTRVYKITIEGLDFLVVDNGSKGGVAITRIK